MLFVIFGMFGRSGFLSVYLLPGGLCFTGAIKDSCLVDGKFNDRNHRFSITCLCRFFNATPKYFREHPIPDVWDVISGIP